MPFRFTMDPAARSRLANLGFDPFSLPHQSFKSCDLCGWEIFRTIAHIDRYGFDRTYQMCEGCGLVFQNPHPTAEGYEAFYANWYRPLVAALWGREEGLYTLQADQRVYAAKIVRFLKPHTRSTLIQSCVDLGGSTGIVAKALQDELGSRCLVVDPCAADLAEARTLGLECEQALAEQWNSNERRFDLVLICRSVDHFLSISAVLAKVASCLRPGGLLFIDPVDFESWARTMLDYRKLFKMDHVYYLSDETMRLYLKTAGFDVVASDFGDGTHISFLARYTGEAQKPAHMTEYARQMGQMLRERLVCPSPPPYPADLLTRIARYVARRITGAGDR